MEESLTQDGIQSAASIEPTVTENIESTADGNQETISGGQTQETVSTAPADNNNSGAVDDDSLSKFAKGQGYSDEDIASMSEREKKTLLSLKKNVDNYRNSDKKLTEEINDPITSDLTEDEVFRREFKEYKYGKKVDAFFEDQTKDRSLEPIMVEILNEKKAELTKKLGEEKAKEYLNVFKQDLDSIYASAFIRSGTNSSSSITEEARREERDSIKRQIAAAPDAAHAVQTTPQSNKKIDMNWIMNEYDSKNLEHRKLVDEFYGKK